MTDHDKLVEEAEEAIRKVFGDTSVDRVTTKESLGTIIGMTEDMLNAMEEED